MAKTSMSQRKTMGRVMHEYAHGELKSGRSGKGGKVKSRRQAIAIALKEAGASKYESKKENQRTCARARRKEATGRTYQQETEGKGRVGARGKRESSRAMGGRNAKAPPAAGPLPATAAHVEGRDEQGATIINLAAVAVEGQWRRQELPGTKLAGSVRCWASPASAARSPSCRPASAPIRSIAITCRASFSTSSPAAAKSGSTIARCRYAPAI